MLIGANFVNFHILLLCIKKNEKKIEKNGKRGNEHRKVTDNNKLFIFVGEGIFRFTL